MKFKDRTQAGRKLSAVLHRFQDKDTVVLALPRGGVVLGAEVARELNAPLGLVLVCKICHPHYPEYAVGAITEDGTTVYDAAEHASLHELWRKQAEKNALELLAYRHNVYFEEDYVPPRLRDSTVLIVDDGVATGLTVQAAVRSVRGASPNKIVVAAPVASAESVSLLEDEADEVIILDNPGNFLGAVGAHYREFPPVDDDQVKTLLKEAPNGIYKKFAFH